MMFLSCFSLAPVYTSQVVFKYTEALALDLRVFAKHGKRAGVGVDDVKCVARKDPKMVGTGINIYENDHDGWFRERVPWKIVYFLEFNFFSGE